MIIAIFPNPQKKGSYTLAKEARDFLTKRGVKVVTDEEHSSFLDAALVSSVDPKKVDIMISMGGDGSILRLIHKYDHIDKPIVGINLGSLGFMADVPVSDLMQGLEQLLSGNYCIQERIVIEGTTAKNKKFFAVNDVVAHRAQNPRLVELKINVDGQYLNTFLADGVIVSTPTGSTAYSLAAGGPILTPTLDAFVITPISPHTISNRPIVINADKKIEICYMSAFEPLEVRSDGLAVHTLQSSECLTLTKSKRKFKLINLPNCDYFETLRHKLGWAGKLQN